MRVAIIILGVLLSSAATAEPQPWLKKENPETLHFALIVDQDCPSSSSEIKAIANGVLIRSRLRPGDYLESEELFGFFVLIVCDRIVSQNNRYAYMTEVRFIRHLGNRNILEFANYGSFGIGDRVAIETSIRGSIENLVMDYLQANFDLTPE